MSNLIVSFATKTVQFPADTEVGQFVVSIGDGKDQRVDAGPVTFLDVLPGDYVVSVAREDKKGVVLGNPVTASVNVPVPAPTTVGVDVPDTVNVTVG